MVFCNNVKGRKTIFIIVVTILILVDGFLQFKIAKKWADTNVVTILILVDGFLQYIGIAMESERLSGHNPYFSRWFSAIIKNSFSYTSNRKSQSLF